MLLGFLAIPGLHDDAMCREYQVIEFFAGGARKSRLAKGLRLRSVALDRDFGASMDLNTPAGFLLLVSIRVSFQHLSGLLHAWGGSSCQSPGYIALFCCSPRSEMPCFLWESAVLLTWLSTGVLASGARSFHLAVLVPFLFTEQTS